MTKFSAHTELLRRGATGLIAGRLLQGALIIGSVRPICKFPHRRRPHLYERIIGFDARWERQKKQMNG